jgi:hypothetical protein
MSRPLDPATKTATSQPVLPLAMIVYLDIETDPLFAWTGIGDLTFGASETGDPSLDGKTFKGLGTVAEISDVSDGVGGSDALEIALPGVDPFEPMMRQLITDRRRWQFRRAIVWMLTLDPDTDAIVGKPFRVKTGRIDRMPYAEARNGGVIKCRIEGQQAYGNEPLNTRYSEQFDINPNDKSQQWTHSLANMSPEIGKVSTGIGKSGGGGSGSSGGFTFGNSSKVSLV